MATAGPSNRVCMDSDTDDRVTGGTSAQLVSSESKKHNGKEEEKIHEEMQDLFRKWVRLTEPEEVQNQINLEEQNAATLFRNVADVKGKKRLFVCCDGTLQNAIGSTRPMSNVAKLSRSIYRIGSDSLDCGTVGGVPQLAYYSSGIGGNSIVGIDGLVAATTGKGFTSTVLNAYCFISNNYNGSSLRDEIILVGYSRGAFAMRCLAQFISDVGLLRRRGLSQLGMFWKLWLTNEKSPGEGQPKWKVMEEQLHYLFFEQAKIKILAEWDPVKSLVWPSIRGKKQLTNMTKAVPKNVENAFVAVSLHENRWSYRPVVWEKQRANGQKVCQCAFLGSHSDIGGGNIDAGLSTISLFWMVALIKTACGARFDDETLLHFDRPGTTRSKGEGTIRVASQAFSEGNVNKSSLLWQVPRFMFLGLCFNGNRSPLVKSFAKPEPQGQKAKQKEPDQAGSNQEGSHREATLREGVCENGELVECGLQIHTTVKWIILMKWKGHNTPSPLKGFTYEEGLWKSHHGTHLEEARLTADEKYLLSEWEEVTRERSVESVEEPRGETVVNGAGFGGVRAVSKGPEREDMDEDMDEGEYWKLVKRAMEGGAIFETEKALIQSLEILLADIKAERAKRGLRARLDWLSNATRSKKKIVVGLNV